MNYLKKLFKCMLLAVLMTCMPQPSLAGNTDDLQEFINRQTRRTTQTHSTDDAFEIDLSKFSATERDKTLKIATGQKYCIVNGTLSRADGLNGPLVSISNGSSVELGDGATVSGSGIPFGYPVVELEEGTLNVTKGTINGVAGEITGGKIDCSIKVPANARNCTLALSGGKVQGIMQCLANDCKTTISGGEYSTTSGPVYSDGAYCIETNSDIELNGSVDLQGICLLGESNKIKLKSALGKKLFVTASGLAHTGAFADGRTIMEGDGYQLSNDDRQQLTSDYYNYKNDCFTLANNKIVYKKDNTIKTTAELQARLSEIAQNGTSTAANPEEIRICTNGISLNNYIKVPENCHAVITGGPIRFQDDYAFGGDAFYIYKSASITLKDITICNSGSWTQGASHYLFSLYGGWLTIGDNVVFKEFDSLDNAIGLARLAEGGDITYNSGTFVCANPVISGSPTNDFDGMVTIYGGTIKSAQTAIDAQYDDVRMQGEGTVEGNGIVIMCDFFLIEGGTIKATGKNSTLVSMDRSGEVHEGTFIGENCNIVVRSFLQTSIPADGFPTIYLNANASFGTYNNDCTYTIDGDWTHFELGKTFIENLPKTGFEKLKFVNMPNDREPYYNEKKKTVSLRKRTYDGDDLQDFINSITGDNKGTEEDPVEIELPSGGVSISNGTTTIGNGEDDLQAFIDGQRQDGGNTGFRLTGNGNFKIEKNCTLRLSNLELSNTGNGYIYVSGTLIIDININITIARQLIRTLPGGHVIWNGSSNDNDITPSEYIYAETNSTLEFKGGNIGGGTCGFRGFGTAYIYDGHISGRAWSGYTYSNSTTYIYGGSFSEKFHNGGTTTITGGTFGDGGYGYIHNGGILNLGGSGWSGATIGNGKSGRIYILGKLEIIIHVLITIEDITTDTPIIIGGNGYVLTEDDLEKILITLPDGYTWKYSQTLNGIIITSTTGIESTTADNDGSQAQYFDINGNRLTQPQKGLNIVKSDNGKAKKLIVR